MSVISTPVLVPNAEQNSPEKHVVLRIIPPAPPLLSHHNAAPTTSNQDEDCITSVLEMPGIALLLHTNTQRIHHSRILASPCPSEATQCKALDKGGSAQETTQNTRAKGSNGPTNDGKPENTYIHTSKSIIGYLLVAVPRDKGEGRVSTCPGPCFAEAAVTLMFGRCARFPQAAGWRLLLSWLFVSILASCSKTLLLLPCLW